MLSHQSEQVFWVKQFSILWSNKTVWIHLIKILSHFAWKPTERLVNHSTFINYVYKVFQSKGHFNAHEIFQTPVAFHESIPNPRLSDRNQDRNLEILLLKRKIWLIFDWLIWKRKQFKKLLIIRSSHNDCLALTTLLDLVL